MPAGPDFWEAIDGDLAADLEKGIAAAGQTVPTTVPVVFRADDIGVVSDRFQRLIDLFAAMKMPLALAVVPTWLTRRRWERIRRLTRGASRLWCWHQHGWRHVDHQVGGKKQEFGDQRPSAAKKTDIHSGRRRLTALMGDHFRPVFTPPWNRCDAESLQALAALGFLAVSRFQGAEPAAPAGLIEISMNVDLHTRKAPDAKQWYTGMVQQFLQAHRSGYWGVMIHHRRMSPAAFDHLRRLLHMIRAHPRLEAVHLDVWLR